MEKQNEQKKRIMTLEEIRDKVAIKTLSMIENLNIEKKNSLLKEVSSLLSDISNAKAIVIENKEMMFNLLDNAGLRHDDMSAAFDIYPSDNRIHHFFREQQSDLYFIGTPLEEMQEWYVEWKSTDSLRTDIIQQLKLEFSEDKDVPEDLKVLIRRL